MIKIRYNSYKGHPFATFVSKLINILSYFLILFSLCFFVMSLDCHPIDIPGAIICAIVFVLTILVLFNHDRIMVFLFFRSKQPAIPSDKTTNGPITENFSPESPLKPKKPIFERYDTYIACPGCGSLVPKGTKQCECGYDLSGPASRIGRRLRRAVPILLCLLLIIAGTTIGYYAGQKNMNSELEKQYALGYESGHEAGTKSGYSDGYTRGIELGAERSARDFQNYYKDGYNDAMDDIGRISVYTPTYFDGLGSLYTRLAESFFLSPNRSKQEVSEILQASGPLEMPLLSASK